MSMQKMKRDAAFDKAATRWSAHLASPLVIAGLLTLAGCDDGTVTVPAGAPTHTIGGTVIGLSSSASGLVIADAGRTYALAAGTTRFILPRAFASATPYAITAKSSPLGTTCSVANGSGTIGSADVDDVAITCSTNTFDIGGGITGLDGPGLVLQNGADSLSVAAGADLYALPMPVAYGADYTVSIKTQPGGVNCAISNASGTVTGTVTNVAVTCSDQSFTLGGEVSGLTSAGLVLANGTDTVSIAAQATTFTLPTAVAFTKAYSVSVQTQPTGLSCVAHNPTTTMPASNVTSVTVTCTPNHYPVGGTISGLVVSGLVLANGADRLAVAANATSFTMPTAVAYGTTYGIAVAVQPRYMHCLVSGGSAAMGAQAVASVTVNCTRNPVIAYAADYNHGTVLQYTVDTATNLLSTSPVASITAGVTPIDIQVSSTSAIAYVVNRDGNTISEYSIDPPTGMLTAIGSIGTGSRPVKMAINPAGTYAYVANYNAGTVSAYRIGTDGLLTELGASPFPVAPHTLTWLAVNPAGTALYVTANADHEIVTLNIDAASGALTSNSRTPTSADPWALVINRTGTYAYAANRSGNSIDEFAIGNQGALNTLGSISPTGGQPIGMAIDPTGQFVYTANNADTAHAVSAFRAGPAGTLTSLGTVPTALYPATITINDAGSALYVVNNGSAVNPISIFSIDAQTGVLLSIGGASGPNGSALNSLAFASP
jgi:6-phosphogluconolactonase (cycloisomerase 2 family)